MEHYVTFICCVAMAAGFCHMNERSYITMAETKSAAKGVNKSEEIRKLATAMKQKGEKLRPVVIVAALKKQGIAVSSPQVSMVLKRMGLGARQARGEAAGSVGGRRAAISVDDLLVAKKIAGQFGSVDRAISALEALKRFQA